MLNAKGYTLLTTESAAQPEACWLLCLLMAKGDLTKFRAIAPTEIEKMCGDAALSDTEIEEILYRLAGCGLLERGPVARMPKTRLLAETYRIRSEYTLSPPGS